MGIFDRLKGKKITKTVEKEELSREKMKINDRDRRRISHGKDNADISAEIVTSKVKQVEIKIEPRDKEMDKPKKPKKSDVAKIKEMNKEINRIKKERIEKENAEKEKKVKKPNKSKPKKSKKKGK